MLWLRLTSLAPSSAVKKVSIYIKDPSNYDMTKCCFTWSHILKPTMIKWAQYPTEIEALIEPYLLCILRAFGDPLFRPSSQQN